MEHWLVGEMAQTSTVANYISGSNEGNTTLTVLEQSSQGPIISSVVEILMPSDCPTLDKPT